MKTAALRSCGPSSPAPFVLRIAGLCMLALLVHGPEEGAAQEQTGADVHIGDTIQSDTTRSGLRIDRAARSVALTATVQAEAFMASLPPDHQYHGLVHRDGGASGKALFVTDVPDTTVARALRELGAEDGGGVPMSAWNLRWVPLVPQPDARVQGTPISVTLEWEGSARPHRLHEVLHDSGGEGVEIRFGGNEDHHEHWDSGCILCFFSCPGGVMSNAVYSIRDHQRGVTTFDAGEALPPDGTEVTFVFTLQEGG